MVFLLLGGNCLANENVLRLDSTTLNNLRGSSVSQPLPESSSKCEAEQEKVDITTLKEMIKSNKDVTGVCTSLITDMSSLFLNNTIFNQDISGWDTSSAQDISGWNTSNVTDMYQMFCYSKSFNQDLTSWDVSKVVNHVGFNSMSSLSTSKMPKF